MPTSLLFETPWWLPTAAIAVGLFVLWTGNKRQEKGPMRVGLGIVLVALLVMLISYLVETPREAAIRRTRQIVAAASAHDWNSLHDRLDAQTSVYGLRGPDQIVESAKRAAEQYEFSSLSVTRLDTTVAATVINVNITVFGLIMGQPAPTDWQFQYQDFGDGWKLRSIQAVSNAQFKEDQIKSRVPS